jgi:hypothetical protein
LSLKDIYIYIYTTTEAGCPRFSRRLRLPRNKQWNGTQPPVVWFVMQPPRGSSANACRIFTCHRISRRTHLQVQYLSMQWAGDPSMAVNKSAPQPTGDAPFTSLTFRVVQATCQLVGRRTPHMSKAGLACSSEGLA